MRLAVAYWLALVVVAGASASNVVPSSSALEAARNADSPATWQPSWHRALKDDDVNRLNDKLFDEPAWRIALTSFLCWIVTSCAVAAGIGGGGLLVPLYGLVLGVGTKRAIPISKATIFGVACGNVFFIARRKHPNANRPLIDYATVVLMQPGELMGVIIGVLLNRFLPDVIIVVLFVVVLSFNAYKTLKKGIARWKAETKKKMEVVKGTRANGVELVVVDDVKEKVAADADDEDAATTKADPCTCSDGDAASSSTVQNGSSETKVADAEVKAKHCERTPELQRMYAEDAVQYPVVPYVALSLMTAFLIVYSLLMNEVFIDDLDNCHPAYWPLYWSPVLVFGAIVFVCARQNIARYNRKVELGFEFIDGDIQWSNHTVRLLTPAAIAAGVAAGLLGIGGGMILGPLFVALNFQPQVGTASTGFMILFTALAGTVQYLAVQKLGWQYALWFGCIGAAGGQTGQRIVKRLIERTGRPSIVVLMLGSIIGLAVLITATSTAVNVAGDAKDGESIFYFDTDIFVCNE